MKPCELTALREQFARNESACDRALQMCSVLANKARLRILCLLAREDFCVGDLVEVVDPGKTSSISQHLRILTLAGYVERRRENKRVIYHLADQRVRDLIRYLENHLTTPENAP